MREATTWVRIAHRRDFPLREGRAVKVGSREIAIFNLGERFLAVENRCPHKGGPLADGIVSGAAVVCPLHAWKFSLETGDGINAASAQNCVATFRTRVEDGIVLLDLSNDSQAMHESGSGDLPAICLEPSGIAAGNDLPLGS